MGPWSEVICRVASIPSITGIRTSITTTSGARLRRELDRLPAVGRLADDLQVVLGVDQRGERGPQQRLVVDDEDAGRHGAA